jgi:hypothetical protein
VQHLQRDLAPRPQIGRAVDRPEPARREPGVDPEPRVERRPDQRVTALEDGAVRLGLELDHA